jgi:adenine specific DNA methylase Mod
MTNKLYYGDNLAVLRESIKDESVDLIYLDPPFNSNANYNVLFKSPSGEQSHAQIEAFEDTWCWNQEAENAFDEVMQGKNTDVAEMLRSMRTFLRENDMMAYLTMMTVRLVELHRVLKDTGSIYLHCDPTASHYLKIILDAVFGKANYRNEIIWKRGAPKNNAKQGSKHFGRTSDTIFFYTKNKDYTFNHQYEEYSQQEIKSKFKYKDDVDYFCLHPLDGPGGEQKGNPVYELLGVTRSWRYSKNNMDSLLAAGKIYQAKAGNVPMKKFYLHESKGVEFQNVWTDLTNLRGNSSEYLGYPTQKPLSLLERIVQASSNEGDVVLDPFCGCGTAVHAAEKLGRKWIGIDITNLAISLIEKRLKDAFPQIKFEVHGTPKDFEGAKALADADKYQFQWWAVSLVSAVPFGGRKKGADGGIDGHIYFKPDGKNTEKAVVSVKGGNNVSVSMIRDLAHVVEREKAKIGVFITLAEPTEPMRKEAIKEGYYETGFGKYPKIQIITIQDLFDGKQPNIPLVDPSAFKRAKVEINEEQRKLNL